MKLRDHHFNPNSSWAGISKINKVENKTYKRILLAVRVVVLFIIIGLIIGIININNSLKVHETDIPFVIEQGESVSSIAKHLKETGAIKSEKVFNGMVFLKHSGKKIKAGEYIIKGKTVSDLIDIFVEGVKRKEIELQFIEGWTMTDMDAYLLQKGITSPGEFYKFVSEEYISKTPAFDMDKPIYDFPEIMADKYYAPFNDAVNKKTDANLSLEGYLFPDTYRFFEGVTKEEIVKRMLSEFEQKFTTEMREDAKNAGHSIYETVIMASILERELRTYKDKATAADIFWRRIEEGMPLQADATVNYVINGNNPSLTLEQTKIDSPYNTYKYPGLPIGPISNPGEDSLKAAIYAAPNDYWYYLSKPSGETVFSKTLNEHNINKQKYL